MKTLKIASRSLWVALLMFSGNSCNNAEKPGTRQQTSFIDVVQTRKEIEALDRQFSEDFRNKDSVALANYYASDGMLGAVKGNDNIVSAFGKMISYGIKNGTPDLLFTTNSLATDDEFVVELGSYRFVDKDGNMKSQGKYVVVWKQEDGEWKIYRDNGL